MHMDDDYEKPPLPPQEPNEEQPINQLPQGVANNSYSTASVEIDEDYEEKVLEKIKTLAAGNGADLDKIKIKHFKGSTLEFLATTKLTLKTKVLERTQPGKVAGPRKVASKAELRELITKEEHKLTHQNDVIKRIQNHLIERKDKGYALNGKMVMLPFLYREFVQYDPCQNCKAQGEVACHRCRATGYEVCPQCRGQGKIVCTQCNGATFIQTANGRQQCNRCHSQGREPCGYCNATGKTQCSVCKTKRTTRCGVCNGHAWNSHVSTVQFDAMSKFEYDKAKVEEKVGALVERLGVDLLEHAHVHPIQREIEQKDAEDERNYITIPYLVRLPHAEFKFYIGDDEYNGMAFGYQVTLTHIPNFTEKLIENGASHLKDAAEERGDIFDKIGKAGQYKTLRHAILASVKLSNDKAALKVKQANPHGISKEKIFEIVHHADQALSNATRKQRIHGLYAGLAAMFALYASYILSPAKAAINNMIGDPIQQAVGDFLVLFAGMGLAIFIVQTMSKGALANALKTFVPADKLKKHKTKTGKLAHYIYGAALPFYLIICEISVYTSFGQTPEWYSALRSMIGL